MSGREPRPGVDGAQARRAVVVMAKAPREGFAKTRLASAYAPRDVARLAECLLEDTLALASSVAAAHVAVLCPSEDVRELAARLSPAVEVVGQDGQGLAAALGSAFRRFTAAGFRRVVALDSDSPHLPPAVLASAFDLLAGADLVVGPTDDGGYYLVGASAAHPGLFDGAPLGTSNALDALADRARALGLSMARTEIGYDVDVPADLARLAADLRLAPERAPRTAALLASWGLVAGAQEGDAATPVAVPRRGGGR